jgi:hypothetical protein
VWSRKSKTEIDNDGSGETRVLELGARASYSFRGTFEVAKSSVILLWFRVYSSMQSNS